MTRTGTTNRAGKAVRWLCLLTAPLLAATACGASGSPSSPAESSAATGTATQAGPPTVVEMVIFNPPSLGAFLPAVIEAREIDLAHHIDIKFIERPPDAYNTEFASGQYPLGGSAALLSEGLRQSRGVDVAYLFNIFDFFGAVVSTKPEVKSLEDLPGHSLAAAASTTNFAMFQWFAKQQGVDLKNVTVQNTATPGLVSQALTGRSDAVQLWEPAYSTMMAKSKDLKTLDMGYDAWEKEFGFSDIPYLGVAAQRSWIDENEELIPDLQATYEDAAEWILANPEDAAKIIAATIPDGDEAVIADLISNNDRLGLNVTSAADLTDAIHSVFEAGMQINYFEKMPDDRVIYGAD